MFVQESFDRLRDEQWLFAGDKVQAKSVSYRRVLETVGKQHKGDASKPPMYQADTKNIHNADECI